MDLQESCYLELYTHIHDKIKIKEQAQTKIRKWWYFVNNDKDIAIIRTCKSNESFTFNFNSILYSNELTLTITDLARELHITFTSAKQKRTYLLQLILRSHHLFKLHIIFTTEYMSNGVCLQLFD